jgi:hypothetical protein
MLITIIFQDEEKKMEELEKMRHKEEKMVAELMREKRRVQEEIEATKTKFVEEEKMKVEEEKRKWVSFSLVQS